ncbi:MAG: type II secretion system F family protein [Lentisphaeria bacterium]|nr:type II secretion system F family protein [Lentisphaeria bacterium]
MSPARPGKAIPPPLASERVARAKEKFEYLAMDETGRELRGTVEAADDGEALARLKQQGLFPMEVWKGKGKGKGKGRKKTKGKKSAGGRRREDMAKISKRNRGAQIMQALGLGDSIRTGLLTIMTRQLSTMLAAGLPLLLSLRTLQEQCGRSPAQKSMRKVLSDLVDKVENGMTFSESLDFHPSSFGRLYVGLVRAGEASGAMEEVLMRLSEYLEKNARMIKKVKAGMTYPVVVLVIAMTITFGLMVGVVPQFAEMFDEILEGVPLPVLTTWVIGLSDFMMHRIGLLIGGMVGVVIFIKIALKTPFGRYAFDWALVTLPPLAGLMRKIAIARFCGTLGTLLNAGVPILDALTIVSETATNEIVRQGVSKLYAAVAEGEKMAVPLQSIRVFPMMVVRMIDIGEQTGALPDMLQRIAKTFEEEVDMALEAMVSLIEPLMICFLAVVIGGIIMALFLPLIKIIEQLGV